MFSVLKYSKNQKNFFELVKKKLKKHDVVIVKNFLNSETKKYIYKFLKRTFNLRKDIRKSGEFKYFQKDYRRLDVGDSYINSRVSRFVLYTEWNNNNKNLYSKIKDIINLRNDVIGTKKVGFEYNFKGYNSKKYKFCDMIRMIQYPTGGGFLSQHNDREYLFPKQMVNVLVPFSKRSNKRSKFFLNFKKGGLFYVKNRIKIDIENEVNVGDLIFHNQLINHGVSSIDPELNFNLKSFCGRIMLNFSIGKFFIK